MSRSRPKPAWLVLAIASGACAAFNGVFAKLTTTELTASWASAVARGFHLSPSNKAVELVIRGLFFALNLVFNAIMWGLFTRALTLASSTVRVSVINTSANFIITAMLGLAIFSESLPGLWWLGAAMLVAGSVITGRREGASQQAAVDVDAAAAAAPGGVEPENSSEGRFKDDEADEVELDTAKNSDAEADSAEEDEDEDGVLK